MTSTSAILRAVQTRSGADFSSYRPATVERRIQNRMISLGVKDLASYHTLLEESEDEARHLVERITIKVSRFYRNAEVFDALRSTVLPGLKTAAAPLRIWSAGCARGEEAYSLAMLLAECGIDGGITATDIDSFALAAATEGVYPPHLVSELPAGMRDRYLHPLAGEPGADLAVCESVKQRVKFELADLTATGEFRMFDLVCCRNVLIYWSADKQLDILCGLLASLRPGGVLCLGEAEWPHAGISRRLEVVSPRLRLFRKLAGDQP